MDGVLPNESENVLNAKYKFKEFSYLYGVSSGGLSIRNLIRRMTLGLADSYRTDLFKIRQLVNTTIFL